MESGRERNQSGANALSLIWILLKRSANGLGWLFGATRECIHSIATALALTAAALVVGFGPHRRCIHLQVAILVSDDWAQRGSFALAPGLINFSSRALNRIVMPARLTAIIYHCLSLLQEGIKGDSQSVESMPSREVEVIT